MSQKLQTNDEQPAVQSATFCLSLLIGLLAVASPGLSSFFPPPAVFGWGCPPCNRSHCPPTACDESLQHADECGCCALCGKLEEEACGGRGNAGGSCNGSGLHCAYRLGSIFGEEGFGICEKSELIARTCMWNCMWNCMPQCSVGVSVSDACSGKCPENSSWHVVLTVWCIVFRQS